MKNLSIRLILYICIAMVPLSCGTRKSVTNIEKNAEVVETKQESKGQVKKFEEKKEVVKEVEKEKAIDENKEITVVELYDSVGVIKSRVITTKIGRKSNIISGSKIIAVTDNKAVDSVYNNSAKKSSEVTSYTKEKKIEVDNSKIYKVLGAVIFFLIFCYFLYRYLARRKI